MKKKKVIILLSIVTIIVIFLVGLLFIMNNKDTVKLKKDNFVFELGEEVPFDVAFYLNDGSTKNINQYKLELDANESINIQDSKITSNEKDYLIVGKYKISVIHKDKRKDFTIEVTDTTQPEFIDFKDKIVVEQNAKDVDLTKFFKAEDLTIVSLLTEGEYSLSEIGDYSVNVIASDESDNQNKKEFTLSVVSLEDAKKANVITKTLDGTIYKSDAMIEYENNKNKQPEVTKQPSQNNSSNNKPSQKPSTNNNQSTNKPVQSSERYRDDIAAQLVQKINNYRVEQGKEALPVTDEAKKKRICV